MSLTRRGAGGTSYMRDIPQSHIPNRSWLRFRPGRARIVALRNTIGDSFAIEAWAEPPTSNHPDVGGSFLVQGDYDDGNGLWISF